MYLLILSFVAVSALTPNEMDLLLSKMAGLSQQLKQVNDQLDDVSAKVDVLVPAYELKNFTSSDEVLQLIPEDYRRYFTFQGALNDFELVIDDSVIVMSHVTAPGFAWPIDSDNTRLCQPENPYQSMYYPSSFRKGPMWMKPPNLCSTDELSRYILFDFPPQFQVALMEATNYYWIASIHKPMYPDFGYQSDCYGYDVVKGPLKMRFVQSIQLNESLPFSLSNFENVLYTMAINEYNSIDYKQNVVTFTDPRIAFRDIDTIVGWGRPAGKTLINMTGTYNFTATNATMSYQFNNPLNSNAVTTFNVFNTTIQALVYDYQLKKSYALAYNRPYAVPVESSESGTSTSYRPELKISFSSTQITYNNTVFPARDTTVLLAVRYYSQDNVE